MEEPAVPVRDYAVRHDYELHCHMCGRGTFKHMTESEARLEPHRRCSQPYCGGTMQLLWVPQTMAPGRIMPKVEPVVPVRMPVPTPRPAA